MSSGESVTTLAKARTAWDSLLSNSDYAWWAATFGAFLLGELVVAEAARGVPGAPPPSEIENRGAVDRERVPALPKSFLDFVDGGASPSGKTRRWAVMSKGGASLGTVQWYAPWRRYTFDGWSGTTFDANCLREIATFCQTNTEQQRTGVRPSGETP